MELDDTKRVKSPLGIFKHIRKRIKPDDGDFIEGAKPLLERSCEIMEAFEKAPTSPAPTQLTVTCMRLMADAIEATLKEEQEERSEEDGSSSDGGLLSYLKSKGLK